MSPCQLKKEVGRVRKKEAKKRARQWYPDEKTLVALRDSSLKFSPTTAYIFSTKSSHVPPWEAGAKAAAAPMIEARMVNFMVLFE
jgi:hypothetical protein